MFSGLLQPTHLIIIAVLALVILGPKKLPEAARGLGQGLREFKHSIGGGGEAERLPATAPVPAEERRSSSS
jgi:sec-independent protein translocase protein TatA